MQALVALLALQDFGVDWIDRVTRELQAERGPFDPRPLAWTASAGVAWYHDDNLFLEDSGEDSDSVLVPFARGRLDYQDPSVSLAADLLLDHKWYSDADDARGSEERFFGRAQYTEPFVSADLAVLLRRESDPVDAVFLDRADRFVSDVLPRLSIDVVETVALELSGHLQAVRFGEDALADASDNFNFRADVTVVARTAGEIDLLLQGGWLGIRYRDHEDAAGLPTAPPDVDGFAVRAGFRGPLLPSLTLEALAGYVSVESDEFDLLLAPGEREELPTADALVRARYQAGERLTLAAAYTRTISFAGGLDPFQVVNRALGTAELQATPEVSLRGRLQFDRTDSALGVERDYWSAGATLAYKPLEFVLLDAGATFRAGETRGDVLSSAEFDNAIFHLGAAVSY